jgi:hypothetical protein
MKPSCARADDTGAVHCATLIAVVASKTRRSFVMMNSNFPKIFQYRRRGHDATSRIDVTMNG